MAAGVGNSCLAYISSSRGLVQLADNYDVTGDKEPDSRLWLWAPGQYLFKGTIDSRTYVKADDSATFSGSGKWNNQPALFEAEAFKVPHSQGVSLSVWADNAGSHGALLFSVVIQLPVVFLVFA